MKKRIPLDRIVTDEEFQIRKLDATKVAEYGELAEFRDPIVVRALATPGQFQIVDGFHRVAAARSNGWSDIEARVFSGKRVSDFVRKAILENATHGVPLSRREREEACKNLIVAYARDGVSPADTTIAKECGLSATTVKKYRQELVDAQVIGPVRTVKDRQGKHRDFADWGRKPAKPAIIQHAIRLVKASEPLEGLDEAAWAELDPRTCQSVQREVHRVIRELGDLLKRAPQGLPAGNEDQDAVSPEGQPEASEVDIRIEA